MGATKHDKRLHGQGTDRKNFEFVSDNEVHDIRELIDYFTVEYRLYSIEIGMNSINEVYIR